MTAEPTITDEARYLAAARAAIDAGDDLAAPWLTISCRECGCIPDAHDPEPDHVLYAGYVLIGCEGYWQVNPRALGIDAPRWQDWRDDRGC